MKIQTRAATIIACALLALAGGCRPEAGDDRGAPANSEAGHPGTPDGDVPEHIAQERVTQGDVYGQSGAAHREGDRDEHPGEPAVGLMEEFRLVGDLSGDGRPETVFVLWLSFGGSGSMDYLAVLERDPDGHAARLHTAPLGGRVEIRAAGVQDGSVVLETIEHGPGDPTCCPGQKLERRFTLGERSLVELPARDMGRLSIADLAGVEWKLTFMAHEEPVPDEVDITLRFDGEEMSGNSGCNRYRATVRAGESPGELSVAAPLTATRAACPPPIDAYERRYLEALQNITRYSFLGGDLILTWRKEGAAGLLHFDS